jgi:hypothetical protein
MPRTITRISLAPASPVKGATDTEVENVHVWASVHAPPPMAALSELISEVTVLIDPLMTVLTAVLRLPVDEIVPLKELLSSDSDVL